MTQKSDADAARAARLAKALRDNLKKRKNQSTTRKARPDDHSK